MSYDAHSDALRMDLPCPEKMVLAVLCHYASDDTQACWASLETLSFTVGVTKQTVRNKLKALRSKGYIADVIERTGSTTIYVLDFAKIAKDARPRGVKEVEGSKRLRGGVNVVEGGVKEVDPINKYKQEINNNNPLTPLKEENFRGAEVPESLLGAYENLLEWQQHRRDMRIKPLQKQSWVKMFKKYDGRPQALVDAIEFSISQGYQGLFDPRKSESAKSQFERLK